MLMTSLSILCLVVYIADSYEGRRGGEGKGGEGRTPKNSLE